MMKFLPGLAAAGLIGLLVSPWPATAQDATDSATAYTALRLVGKTLGADAISHVIEMTGRNGTPQPDSWKIILKEENATREIVVARGKIVSQHVVHGASALRPIVLKTLNLDSSGAFDATDAQARKVRLRFDSLNYSLRVSETTGKPVWNLALYTQAGVNVGTMRLAAHDGNLLSITGPLSGQAAPPSSAPIASNASNGSNGSNGSHMPAFATDTHPSVASATPRPRSTTTTTTTTTWHNEGPAPQPEPERVTVDSRPPDDEGGGFFTRAGHVLDRTTQSVGDTLNTAGHHVDSTMRHTGENVDHTVRRAGAKVQRFFTGHSDIDAGVPRE